MAVKPIPRDPAGRIAWPGDSFQRYSVDFSAATDLPAWLTPTLTGAATHGINGGRWEVSTPTGAGNDAVTLTGPTIDLAAVRCVVFTVESIYRPAHPTPVETIQGVTTIEAVTGNTGLGAMLHNPHTGAGTYLRGTVGDWPPANSFMVDNVFNKGTARISRTLAVFPRVGMVYALEGDQVMRARDLSATMLLGSVNPILRFRVVSTPTIGSLVIGSCSAISVLVGL